MPVNHELHTEQILQELDNKDVCPSGYSVEISFKKISESMQATPSLVYVSECAFIVGDNQKNTMESSSLVSNSNQDMFESEIKAEKNSLTIEVQFNIITDKNVMTKCKCRAYCNYHNSSGVITWKSEKPMVFFYGHGGLKRNDEISVL